MAARRIQEPFCIFLKKLMSVKSKTVTKMLALSLYIAGQVDLAKGHFSLNDHNRCTNYSITKHGREKLDTVSEGVIASICDRIFISIFLGSFVF